MSTGMSNNPSITRDRGDVRTGVGNCSHFVRDVENRDFSTYIWLDPARQSSQVLTVIAVSHTPLWLP